MNPMLFEFLKALFRYALSPVFAYLVAKGVIQTDEAETYMLGFILFVIPLLWAWFDQWRKRRWQLTAQAMPAGATEQEVKDVAKRGGAPSVSMKIDESPAPISRTMLRGDDL